MNDDLFVVAPVPYVRLAEGMFPYLDLRCASGDFGGGGRGRVDNPPTVRMGERFEAMDETTRRFKDALRTEE